MNKEIRVGDFFYEKQYKMFNEVVFVETNFTNGLGRFTIYGLQNNNPLTFTHSLGFKFNSSFEVGNLYYSSLDLNEIVMCPCRKGNIVNYIGSKNNSDRYEISDVFSYTPTDKHWSISIRLINQYFNPSFVVWDTELSVTDYKVEEKITPSASICTCSSRDLFNYGCRCGAFFEEVK
jgi:hypothetical protein